MPLLSLLDPHLLPHPSMMICALSLYVAYLNDTGRTDPPPAARSVFKLGGGKIKRILGAGKRNAERGGGGASPRPAPRETAKAAGSWFFFSGALLRCAVLRGGLPHPGGG
jgi:hypothetical protein